MRYSSPCAEFRESDSFQLINQTRLTKVRTNCYSGYCGSSGKSETLEKLFNFPNQSWVKSLQESSVPCSSTPAYGSIRQPLNPKVKPPQSHPRLSRPKNSTRFMAKSPSRRIRQAQQMSAQALIPSPSLGFDHQANDSSSCWTTPQACSMGTVGEWLNLNLSEPSRL